MSKVSVIIPTHNRAELIGSAIRSVLNQTYQDFEIIVVDDASKDNTEEVISSFNDKRIKYIHHQTNKGEAGARNTGVTNSKGQFIGFLDDDDEWLPSKLQKQVELLERSPLIIGGVYTTFVMINRADKRVVAQITARKRGAIFNDMLIKNRVGTPSTVLLRRECFDKVGLFDEGISFGPDYDMWLRISREFDFEYINEPLVKYYVHDNRLSTNTEIQIKGREAILKKHEHLFALNKRYYSYCYLTLGLLYCYNKKMKEGRRLLWKAIRTYPFEIRNYYNFGLSLLGEKALRRVKEIRDRIATTSSTREKVDG